MSAGPVIWVRGEGVMLRAATASDLDMAGVQRALRDGIARGYDGVLPESHPDLEWYAIVARRPANASVRVSHARPLQAPRKDLLVGVVAVERDTPLVHTATVQTIAIVPSERGHAFGARALFAVERRLTRDGIREFYARVPRTNGHGLYFMLRCGYAPIPQFVDDATTWFQRAEVLRRAAPRALPGAAHARDPGGA